MPGIKNFSGEKIQFLASELRDRIRHSAVSICVVDRTARAEFRPEPRKFEGWLLHELDDTTQGAASLSRAAALRRGLLDSLPATIRSLVISTTGNVRRPGQRASTLAGIVLHRIALLRGVGYRRH